MRERLTKFEQIEVGDILTQDAQIYNYRVTRLRRLTNGIDVIAGKTTVRDVHYRFFSYIQKKKRKVTNWKAVIER